MRRLLLLVLPLLVLAACGDDAGDDGEEAGGNEVETTPLTFGDGSEVWLRVETGGGFVPMIYNLRQTPQLLLFDDGRLVRRVVDEDIDQIVPEFVEVQLDESATADLLDQFAAVVDGPAVGDPPVTDLPTTTIEVTTDGDARELGIYALDWTDGLTDDERAARQAAMDAIGAAFDLDGGEPYVPEEWLVLTVFSGIEPGGITPWPLDADRIAGGGASNVCTRLDPDEFQEVADALDRTSGYEGMFIGPNGSVEVALRPVLTGDEQCNLSDADQFVER